MRATVAPLRCPRARTSAITPTIRAPQKAGQAPEFAGHEGRLYRHRPRVLTGVRHGADTLHMRWILRRGTEQLRYEIHTGSGQTPYALRIAASDGRVVLDERFPEPYALHERAARVERLLIRHGWRGPLLDH